MKKLFFIAFLLMVNLQVFSQYREVLFDDSGNPVIVRLSEKETVKNYFLDEVSDDGIYTIDTDQGKLIIDAGLYEESASGTHDPLIRTDNMTHFDPSPTPNGDFVQKISYTPDGNFILVLHKHSDNLFIYNSGTFEIEQIIDLGRGPMDMKVTNDFIYVCCYYAKEIQIVDLNTFSVSSTIELQKQPCQIELNADNSIAYVGLTDDGNGAIAAFNLDNGTQIFETSEPNIYRYGKIGTNGRIGYIFMRFYLSPDDEKIIAQTSEHNKTAIYNAQTGSLRQTYSLGTLTGGGFSMSGDTMFCSVEEYPSHLFKVFRIDMENLTVIDSVIASNILYGGFADLAINADGSKVLSMGDVISANYMFFDFKTYQYKTIPGASIKSSNMVLKIDELDYAVMFNWGHFDIVDLNTGEVVTTSNDDIEVGWTGAVSPSGNKMFLSDGVCDHTSIEYFGEEMHAIDISDPANFTVDTSFYTGDSFEADETNMAYLIDDGTKLIASNKLSHNISIVDVETGSTDTLIYYKGISGMEIIPGKNQAIVYADLNDTIRILDLETYTFIASLDVGQVNVLLVSNDGEWSYILDYHAFGGIEGNLTKVRLDGADSFIEEQIQVNAAAAYFWYVTAGISFSGAADITPDGKYFFYLETKGNGEYFIGIVDVEEMEIVASLPIDANAMVGFAFSDDSNWGLALAYNYNPPIVYIDGEDSYISSYFQVNDICTSATFNPVDGLFYAVQNLYQYHAVNPETGEIVKTFDTNEKFQFNIEVDDAGNPLVLSTTKLMYRDEVYPMIGRSKNMNYYEDQGIFVIPVPGPDKIVTFGDLPVGIPESPQYAKQETFDIIPNPAYERIQIQADVFIDRIEIIDMTGTVQINEEINSYKTTLNVSILKSGIYLVRLISGADIANQKMYVY